MSNIPAPAASAMQDFQHRVLEKLKTDIGSLMPDEALEALVQQAVKDTFFAQRKIPKPGRGQYSDETIPGPSWFQEQLMMTMEPRLKSAVEDYVRTNAAMIDEAIRAALDHDKLMLLTAAVMGDRIRDGLFGLAKEFIQELKNQGIIRY